MIRKMKTFKEFITENVYYTFDFIDTLLKGKPIILYGLVNINGVIENKIGILVHADPHQSHFFNDNIFVIDDEYDFRAYDGSDFCVAGFDINGYLMLSNTTFYDKDEGVYIKLYYTQKTKNRYSVPVLLRRGNRNKDYEKKYLPYKLGKSYKDEIDLLLIEDKLRQELLDNPNNYNYLEHFLTPKLKKEFEYLKRGKKANLFDMVKEDIKFWTKKDYLKEGSEHFLDIYKDRIEKKEEAIKFAEKLNIPKKLLDEWCLLYILFSMSNKNEWYRVKFSNLWENIPYKDKWVFFSNRFETYISQIKQHIKRLVFKEVKEKLKNDKELYFKLKDVIQLHFGYRFDKDLKIKIKPVNGIYYYNQSISSPLKLFNQAYIDTSSKEDINAVRRSDKVGLWDFKKINEARVEQSVVSVPNFKEGDIIECVDNYDNEDNLTIGKDYQVLEVRPLMMINTYIGSDFMVKIINDKGEEGEFFEERFKLAEHYKRGKKTGLWDLKNENYLNP